MSWFRSSRRRRSAESAERPAGPPRPARADLENRPLADLHELAAQWEVPRYRLLRRAELIHAISGEEQGGSLRSTPREVSPPSPAAPPPPAAAPPPPAPPPRRPRRRPLSVEPAHVPEPEPEVDEPAEGELRTGILDLVGEGYGFVRVGGLMRSAEDPYVSRTLVREFSLRRGDEVTGRVIPRRAGERHGRMVTVEWRTHSEAPPASFDDFPVQRPTRTLRAQAGTDSFALRMTELVSPLAIGQRALVAGPPGAGATHLLREMARGLIGGEERLIVVLVDVRPEEVPEWEISEEVEVNSAPSDRPPREQVALAELVLERGKRLAEQGEDVIVVLDSITRLARAYGLARARPGDDAPTPELLAVEGAKRWFASARDTGSGSLTLLAAGRVDSESPLETLVHESLLDTAGAVVRLDPELAAQGLHPAIDPRRSRTLGEEALVPEDRRGPLNALRSVMRSLDPVEAWELASARVRETASNDELLDQAGAGPAPGQRS